MRFKVTQVAKDKQACIAHARANILLLYSASHSLDRSFRKSGQTDRQTDTHTHVYQHRSYISPIPFVLPISNKMHSYTQKKISICAKISPSPKEKKKERKKEKESHCLTIRNSAGRSQSSSKQHFFYPSKRYNLNYKHKMTTNVNDRTCRTTNRVI